MWRHCQTAQKRPVQPIKYGPFRSLSICNGINSGQTTSPFSVLFLSEFHRRKDGYANSLAVLNRPWPTKILHPLGPDFASALYFAPESAGVHVSDQRALDPLQNMDSFQSTLPDSVNPALWVPQTARLAFAPSLISRFPYWPTR